MLGHLHERCANGKCPNGVMIIIHGGNQAPRSTIKLTRSLYSEIERAGYYPVFINWDASIGRCYVQQLLFLRSGMYRKRPWHLWPFFLAADICRGVALYIPALVQYVDLLRRSRKAYKYPTTQHLEKFDTPNLKEEGSWPGGLTVSVNRAIWSLFVQLPILFLTGACVPRAWENLLRRTRAMFRAPREFELERAPDGTSYQDCEGAMAVFLRALADYAREHPGTQVTYLAHSMGSMIANDALQYARGLPTQLPIKSIIYLAPACSVRSFAAAVDPVLHEHPGANAYVLTLHPRLEAACRDWHRLIAGSALEWLEGTLATPHSYLDRMLGKWDNALRTLHVYKHGRDRLHFKSFAYNEPPKRPCSHSDFYHPDLDPPFWSPEFWWELQQPPSTAP
jgi:hypothetical protein